MGRALLRAYCSQLLTVGILGFLAESLMGLAFYLTSFLIQNLVNQNLEAGLYYTAGFTCCAVVAMVLRFRYQLLNSALFVQIREGLSALLYKKSLRLGLRSISEVSEGKIINAASSDLVVLDFGHIFVVHLMFEPFVAIVHLALMIQLVGYEACFGFLVILLIILLQIALGKCITALRDRASKLIDTRLKMLYDVISGIRTIKAYGWELEILKWVTQIRSKETRILVVLTVFKSVVYTILRYCGYFSVLAIFYYQSAGGQTLEVGKSFSVLSSFTFLSLFMGLFLGYSITTLAEFKTTLARTAQILSLEEKGEEQRQLANGTAQPKKADNQEESKAGIQFKKADFSWGLKLKEKRGTNRQEEHFDIVLQSLDFKIKRGELFVVIGPVGSGKTSLLLSILGENYLVKKEGSGLQKPQGVSTAYVEQVPFILSETVQSNITFGLPYDSEKFDLISKLACLEQDYTQLAKGQDTEIGERGVNLSGGQKARVSLARALYSDASLYLLDDPLSAVDPKVSSRLMEKAIQGHLKSKTRILVTHQLHVLPKADRILYLDQGKVKFLGTFNELQETELDLSTILEQKNEDANENKKHHQSQELGPSKLRPQIEDEQRHDQIERNGQAFTESKDQKFQLNGPLKRTQTCNLIIAEQKKEGGLSCRDICQYTSYSLGKLTFLVILVISTIPTILNLYFSEWVRIWVQQPPQQQVKAYYRNMFLLILVLYFLTTFLRNYVMGTITLIQTQKLHNKMLFALLRTPVSFFDSNPVGRILNRFSKDISIGDMVLPVITNWFLEVALRMISILVILCIAVPWSCFLVAFVIALALVIRLKVLRVIREAMKLNLISRSPVASLLGATLSGLPTIRAYNKVEHFQRVFQNHVDVNGRAFMTFQQLSRSLAFYLDAISLFLATTWTFLCFLVRYEIDPLLLALTIQLVNGILVTFSFAIRMSSDIENYMNAISRCLEYERLPSEAPLSHDKKKKPNLSGRDAKIRPLHDSFTDLKFEEIRTKKGGWIVDGDIKFENVCMQYRVDLPPALSGLTVSISPRMKVGIVGRTGAGKSSILHTLFRMVELEKPGGGRILIDGVDIGSLCLHELRKNISIIPQSPFIFQGSIRENLLPTEEKKREGEGRIWRALEDVELGEYVRSLEKGLDTMCSDANAVFSAGQKQLVCLARAILNENKILVLDEATANVDMATDKIIQRTMRKKFAECTVLTIAHRLDTIIDSDLVVVMDQGKCVESGHPFTLLVENENDLSITSNSHFAGMVKQAKTYCSQLLEKAKESYNLKYNLQ